MREPPVKRLAELTYDLLGAISSIEMAKELRQSMFAPVVVDPP